MQISTLGENCFSEQPCIQELHVNRMLIVNQVKGPEIQIGLQLELVVNN